MEKMEKTEFITSLAKQLIEEGNTGVIDSYFSIDYIAHASQKQYQGHVFLKRWTKQMHLSIQNIKVVNIVFLVQDKHCITWQRTLTGKHKNDLKGIPGTNKRVTWTEMVVSKFKNNKIIEERVVSELAGELMLKQSKK